MNGIKIISLKKIKTPQGDIYKFLSKKDKYFKKFEKFIFLKLKRIKKRMELPSEKQVSYFYYFRKSKISFFKKKKKSLSK